jgi:hypothetical protein
MIFFVNMLKLIGREIVIDVYTLVQFYRNDMALTIKHIRANEIKNTNVKNIDFAMNLNMPQIINSNKVTNNFFGAEKIQARMMR